MAIQKSTCFSVLLSVLSLSIISGCGGGSLSPTHTAASPADQSITAALVFNSSMIGQTWTFEDAYGDQTFIQIQAAPFCAFGICDGKSVVWVFTKTADRAYWDPGFASELWFYLHPEADGSWACIGFEWVENGSQKSAAITTLPGWNGKPYTIIPASSSAQDANTAYRADWQYGLSDSPIVTPDGSWVSTWTTYNRAESFTTPLTGSNQSLVSKQCEGGTSGGCDLVVETWHFCPGVGLCGISPASDTKGLPVDPKLAIVRVR
jgi:hypothetical protein